MLRRDVFNWLLVLCCVLVAFAFALFVLHAQTTPGVEGARDFLTCVAPDAFNYGGQPIGVRQALWYLQTVWESALLGESHFECASSAAQPWLALPLLYVLQILVSLLLINML